MLLKQCSMGVLRRGPVPHVCIKSLVTGNYTLLMKNILTSTIISFLLTDLIKSYTANLLYCTLYRITTSSLVSDLTFTFYMKPHKPLKIHWIIWASCLCTLWLFDFSPESSRAVPHSIELFLQLSSCLSLNKSPAQAPSLRLTNTHRWGNLYYGFI